MEEIKPVTKYCRVCKIEHPVVEMKVKKKSSKTGLPLYSTICKKKDNERIKIARKANILSGKRRKRKYKSRHSEMIYKKYGITPELYLSMVEEQKGLCLICKQSSESKLNVDHDHETGKVRGLLCGPCNNGLGCFKDDINRLNNAIKYLTLK